MGKAWGHLCMALAMPRSPWAFQLGDRAREPERLPCLWPKGTALGFPWLLERQPFGEVPVFPGGVGRAAQDTWIPLLPASSSLCEEGWRNSRTWWLSQPVNVTSYTRWKLGACNLERQNGGHLTGERKEQEREEEKLLFSSSSACILGPVLSQLGPRLWLPAS